MNGQDGRKNQRRGPGSTREVLGIPKRPHLPETENYSPQNAASAAVVPAGGPQHIHKKSIIDKVGEPCRNSYKHEELGRPGHQFENFWRIYAPTAGFLLTPQRTRLPKAFGKGT